MKRDFPDGNAKDLCDNLDRQGWRTARVQAGDTRSAGLFDRVVGHQGWTHGLEIKMPGAGLNKNQVRFLGWWTGCYHRASTSDQAIELMLECEARKR